MSEDFRKVQADIVKMHTRIRDENYYQILGVDDQADGPKIGASYRQLAKKWHIDRFSAYELQDEQRKMVQDIFSFINDANRTLTNADAREDYDADLHDGPNLADILASEGAFRSGKTMLERGSYKGAFEQFKEAHELNPDEMEFEAYFLYAEYLLLPKDDEGLVKDKARPTEIYDRMNVISEALEKDWLMQFMGTVSLGLGKLRRAEQLLREALYKNKNNTNAQRQLRLIVKRKEKKANSGGFFSKLFKKK